ncbi:MAG: 30S ribosomal protein S17 [Gammaproteobacteria bacterium]|nr:30S ribosomal protein S17 [Gammaproteobacteria bacterium]
MSQDETGSRELIGQVVSDRMDKTVTVKVERRVPHPLYKKYVRKSSKFAVHDEQNICRTGDTVAIVACRPLSKRKSWQLARVVERAE